MVTVPEPSSSAPGAARREGIKRLMLSWWAPMTTVRLDFPRMVAMLLFWPQGCLKVETVWPYLWAEASARVMLILSKSQADD